MMDTVIPSEIAHLDFDPSEDEAPKCYGYSFVAEDKTKEENKTCQKRPVLIATRACCGLATMYCLGCYNRICKAYANGEVGLHVECNTTIKKPFTDNIKWL